MYLLLALAAADLFVPGLCLVETPAPIGSDASSGLPLDSDFDDCFCCCAHVVPEHIATWDRAVDVVRLVPEATSEFPPVSPTRPFHPPRA